jgi:hypothetical protein
MIGLMCCAFCLAGLETPAASQGATVTAAAIEEKKTTVSHGTATNNALFVLSQSCRVRLHQMPLPSQRLTTQLIVFQLPG